MSTFAIALAGITPEQLTLLSGSGILNDVDLRTLSQSDFDELLPSATIVTRRRLYSIGQYATSGETLTAATTMLDILTKINNKSTSPTTSVTAPLAANTPDPSRGAPKMYVDGLADFWGGGSNQVGRLVYRDWCYSRTTGVLFTTFYSSFGRECIGEHSQPRALLHV